MNQDMISRSALLQFIREQGEAQGAAYDWTLMMEDVASFPAVRPRLLTAEDFGPDICDQDGFRPAWMEYSPQGAERMNMICMAQGMEPEDSLLVGWEVIDRDELDYGRPYGRYWTGKPSEELRAATPWESRNGMSLNELLALRDKMLTTLDLADVRAYFDAANIPIPSSQEVLMRSLHKGRCHWLGCPPELRAESLAWLDAHNSSPNIDPDKP